MDIVLVAGLWLDATAWDLVAPLLEQAGHRVEPVVLPGQGAGTTATLGDQVDAVVAAVDRMDAPVMVVGHSAASTLAWLAADRRPDDVAQVVMVGGMPAAHGELYAPLFELDDGVMPFPGWGPFEGPDSDDLSARVRAEFEARAIPVPEAVAHGTVEYTNEKRKSVPVVLVCPEFSSVQARRWFEAGEMPELRGVERLDYVDVDSGHWPMFTKPRELADVLHSLTAIPARKREDA